MHMNPPHALQQHLACLSIPRQQTHVRLAQRLRRTALPTTAVSDGNGSGDTGSAPDPVAIMQRLQQKMQETSARQGASSSESSEYIGGDGRKKATFEDAFRMDRELGDGRMPWQFSWQRNERTLTFTDEHRAHMVKGFAARELGISQDSIDRRIQELVMLLPELPSRLALLKPKVVAFLAEDTNRVALRLVHLKDAFPTANAALMAVKQPSLLMERSSEQLATASVQLRELLPDFDIDWLVERHPQVVLDVPTFAETLAEAKRMLPNVDIRQALVRNPQMIFSFERRSSMIPYDQ